MPSRNTPRPLGLLAVPCLVLAACAGHFVSHGHSVAAATRSGTDLPPAAQSSHYAEYHAYGDSITHGSTLDPLTLAYPNLLAEALGLPLKNRAVSGIETCSIFYSEMLDADWRPTTQKNVLYTLLSGTNDLHLDGAGAHEAIFNTCQQAIITWLATPREYRTNPSDPNFTAADGCMAGGVCVSGRPGSIVVKSMATTGAPLYLWYGIDDAASANSAFAVSVDGKLQGTYATKPSTPISKRGRVIAGALARIPLAAGVHVVTIATQTGGISILGLGTLPPRNSGMRTTVLVGDFPSQLRGKELDPVADQQRYSADIRANVALLANDGIDVRMVPTRRYLTGEPAEFTADSIHPNATGHQHLYQAFRDTLAGQLGRPKP